jgi:hypothetical protein
MKFQIKNQFPYDLPADLPAHIETLSFQLSSHLNNQAHRWPEQREFLPTTNSPVTFKHNPYRNSSNLFMAFLKNHP